MKELSIEEKAKAYDEAIKRLEDIDAGKCQKTFVFTEGLFDYIFPELKESEDERIRKKLLALIEWSKSYAASGITANEAKEMIALMEKQGEHANFLNKIQIGDKVTRNEDGVLVNLSQLKRVAKPIDKVEPKFKVGDWVIDKQGVVHQISNVIENVTNHTYGYDIVGGGYFNDKTEGVRLWTIQDAKDGDVLCNYHETYDNPLIFILKKFERVYFGLVTPSDYSSYCFLTAGDRQIFKEGAYHHEHNIKPAAKEQRDLLFQKMHEAGYEWNAEKKELKKIEQKPAWSEEDEVKINRIVACLENLNVADNDILLKDINWLKSLIDRYTWKPSDEQIELIKDIVFKDRQKITRKELAIFHSIYKDLKKLKG